MKLSISEMARRTGVSVRTLHYYDQIGLLHPSMVSEQNGYRFYGGEDMAKMQQILFYRELEFSLKEIKNILSHPEYNRTQALIQQKQLLQLKEKRLKALIKLVDDTLKGEKEMSFKAFDMAEIEKAKEAYGEEARERWGESDAYKESMKKTEGYNKEDWQALSLKADEIFEGFAKLRGGQPGSEAAQELVKRWQDHISGHFYQCTDEILEGLGQMYTGDERFKKNIDKYGEGTADFMSRAIQAYLDS